MECRFEIVLDKRARTRSRRDITRTDLLRMLDPNHDTTPEKIQAALDALVNFLSPRKKTGQEAYPTYSDRIAEIGSMRTARSAGTKLPITAISIQSPMALANVTASAGRTPARSPSIARPAP